MIIKKGTQVKIITGKDRGITGEILEIDRKQKRVKIKSINNHYIQREILYSKFRNIKKINLTAAE